MPKTISNISVDCVIFGFDFKQLNVLLVERKLEEPKSKKVLIDDWTLVGYHILEDENIDNAAARILKSMSGLDHVFLEQFHTFGNANRLNNPKDKLWLKHQSEGFSDRVVTVAYLSLIDSTSVSLSLKERNVKWYPVNELPELGFDHRKIFEKGLDRLRDKVRSEPIGFELLPEKFTISQLQRLYEEILGTEFDRRNFRKKVLQMKYVIPLDEKQKGVKHKPAQLFIFSREVYEKTKTERFDFSV
ncbi:MAG: NUDIX domain-containing protein [Prolixibacteraceae bacterium]|jgi:8-oxo-dGTP diphosphatase|nr:NUDIX domain-containing protein [Prolixibacteraceae bacterium]